MNKNNRIIRCVLCLVLALAMVFAPVLSSYAVMITVSNGDPVTVVEDETSDVTDISDDSGDLKEAEQADTAADSLDEQISGEEVSDIDSSDSDSEQNAEESSDAAEQKDDQIAEELRKNETADEDPEPEAVKTEYVYQGNGVKVTAVLDDPEAVPAQALSVGIGTVTDAKEVLVLISGHNKARAMAAVVEGGVSQKWTCSALQMHNGAIIACDEEACGELTVDTYKYFLDIERDQRL